ncbi:MAG: hypothetical protein ACOC2H_10670, partial [Spirochaetota bacterium]
MKKSIALFFALSVSFVLAFTGCDFLEDAEDALNNAGAGVKGTVKKSIDGKPLKGANVTVIGFASLKDLTALTEAVNTDTKKIDVEAFVNEARTKETVPTDGDGEYNVRMDAAAYVVLVEKEDEGYISSFTGFPEDKKLQTFLDDMTDSIKDYVDSGFTKFDFPKWSIVVDLKSRKTRNFKLGGGPDPAPAQQAEEAATAPAEPPAPSQSSDFVAEDASPQPKTPPADAPDNEKEYYGFSFVFAGTMDGSAYGEFDRDTFGQPIPVTENAKYVSDGSDNWTADDGTTMPVK